MFRAIVAAVYIAGGQVVVPSGAPIHVSHPLPAVEQMVKVQATKPPAIEQPAKRQIIRLFHFSPAQLISKESLLMRLFRRAKTLLSWNKYTQSNIKYDSVGRATSYHLKTTQIEHYDYYTQVQKGLKRKNARKSVTEAVTTESDVQVLEFDGFGRQVHTVVESNRSDKGKTWTQTDTRIKSFDEFGRAKDVDRQTQSRVTVVKKKGSLGMKIAAIATMCVAPILGAAMLASTSLGGQNIYSNSHTVSQNQYKADGTLDEVATKAKTTILEENTYQQGKNFGDKTMQAVDIAVAVGAVVAAVVLMIIPGTQALAGFCIAAASAMYAVARNGISTHDLGMFGENHDRAEGKHNAMVFCSSVVTVAVAGAAAWMSAPSTAAAGANAVGGAASTANATGTATTTLATASGAAQLSGTARAILTGIRVVGQMAAAKAGGASSKAMWTVAALTVASSVMNGGDTGGIGGTMTKIQGAFAIAGSLVTNIGLTYGKQSQKTTWLVVGSGLSGASGDPGAIPTSVLKTYAMELYAKKNDGSGGLDQDKLNQGLVTQAVGEAFGSALGFGTQLYGAKKMGKTLAEYRAMPPQTSKTTFKSFMVDMGAGLLSPFKALAGFAMALTPRADRASALAAQRGDNLVVSASGETLAIKMDPTGGLGKIEGNRISLNPGVEINGLKVASGSLVKNESGQWQVEKLTFEITQFGSLPLNSKGLMEVDGQGNRTIILPGESLGVKGATVRFDGGSGFYSQKGTDLYQIGTGAIEQGGVTYQIQNLQLNRDKASTILVGAILTKDNQQFVMNTKGDVISTDELVQRVVDLGISWKAVAQQVQVLESKLGSAYNDVAEKINAIAARFGSKGTFDSSLDVPGARDARWQMEKLRETVMEQGAYLGSMVQMIKTGRPDLAFSLMGTGGSGVSDLAKGVELIRQGIDGFTSDAGKLVRSFELLNMFSANTTESGLTRVQDRVGLAKAYGEFKSSLKALVSNPLTSDHVKVELMKLYAGAENLLKRPVDAALFKREERGTFKDLPSVGGSKPGITDWILHPRGTFLKVSTNWMGLSPAKEASVNMLVAAIDLAITLNPMEMGAKFGETATNKHLIEKSYVAAINFTEDLQKDATAPNADFQSQMAGALNPVRFIERTYHWMEVNGDQPGSNLGAAGIFTLGIAMNAFEMENPIAIVAKVMPTIVQRNVNDIGEVAGWSKKGTEKWGERIGTLATVATFAAGGFKEPPSLVEFGIKTTAFYGSAVTVTEGSKYAVAHWNVGGNDKELANEIVQSMINGGMMVGGKYASKAAKALETYAGEKSNQIVRFGLKVDQLTAKREALAKESVAVDQQIQLAKTDLAVESALAQEVESLSKIQKNNAPEGAQRGTRPIRTDAGAGGELEQGSDLSVLLQEAERAGEAQRGVGRGAGEAQEGVRNARQSLQLLEDRKQSIGSEIRRTDSQIETLRGARAKAESVVYKTVGAPTAGAVGLRILSLFAQSDEPLLERSTPSEVLNPAPTGKGGFFQSTKELVTSERGSILVEPPPLKEIYTNFKNKLFGKVSPSSSAEGPPALTEKTHDLPKAKQLELPLQEKSAPAQNPLGEELKKDTRLDSKPRELSGFDHQVLEKNYKKILPEDFLRLETTLKNPNRIETTVKDPSSGAANLHVSDPHTGVVIVIDGKGNVLNINDPSKTPRAQSPPLNKSNTPGAGPQAQDNLGSKIHSVPSTKAIAPYWPSNDGFLREPVVKSLGVGEKIDRWGSPEGRFVSPEGTPFELRGIPSSDKVNKPYFVYEVVKPFEVRSGIAKPAFGQLGQGVQYGLPKKVRELIDLGYLREVKNESR